MSRCLDCTECRTCPKAIPKVPRLVQCRANVFGAMLEDNPFLSVQRKCVYFEKEGVGGNTSGDQGSDS